MREGLERDCPGGSFHMRGFLHSLLQAVLKGESRFSGFLLRDLCFKLP